MVNRRERIIAEVFEAGEVVSSSDVTEWTFGDLEAWIQDAEDAGFEVIMRPRSSGRGAPLESYWVGYDR
jgi:hypothetical protein